MNQTLQASSIRPTAKITTEATASQFHVTPQAIRAGLWRNGHYMGMRPVKLPNGKLLWDPAEINHLLSGGAA